MGFFDKEQVPTPPDMSGVVNAANAVGSLGVQLGQEQLDWAKQQFADNKNQVDQFVNNLNTDADTSHSMIQNFQDLSNKQMGIADDAGGVKDIALDNAAKQSGVQDTQLGIQQDQLAKQNQQFDNQQGQLGIQQGQLGIQQGQLGVEDQQLANQSDQLGLQQDFRGDQQALQAKADQLFDQYSQTYAPAQAKFMADAEAYGTPEKLAQARAGAQANVGDQFQAARDAATRQLESFGIKPSDTRFAALDLGTRIKEAAQKAASGDAASLTAEDKAFALQQAAIAQGANLPNASSTASGVANQAGSNVVGQGNVANAAGSVANAAGSNANAAGANAVGAGNTAVGFGNTAVGLGGTANQAGANAVGAGNATTSAINSATGALNTQVGATQGATQAETGALGANTAGAVETGAAGDLVNKTYATGAAAMGSPDSYLNTGLQGTLGAGTTEAQAYDNQMKQFKAEQTNTSGLGALLGTVAGPLLKAGLAGATGGASLVPDIAGNAFGGSASSPLPGLSADDYGAGASVSDSYGFAEGGAIPMSASPSRGRQTDDVRAQLNAGEFIMPKDVTSWYGEKFLQQLIQKAKIEKDKAQAKPAIGPAMAGPPAVVSRRAIPMGAQ